MQEYASKEDLISEIKKTASAFIKEYDSLAEANKDLRLEKAERTPFENLAYQLGWMALVQQWKQNEKDGKPVATPALGIKWNQMSALHQPFYRDYQGKSLEEMIAIFHASVDSICAWIESISDEALFKPGGRKWAASTPANWPVWRWVHINTVAPFKTFRTKVRKWNKLYASKQSSIDA